MRWDERFSGLVAIVLAVAMTTMACGESDSKSAGPPLEPLMVSGVKADVADRVRIVGEIQFGVAVLGKFFEDLQFDAYTFTAAAGSRVTIENTYAGTSRALDSTLFLYGPAGEAGDFGTSHIAFDDDSGWGLHAKITGFAIPQDGAYLVVIGTHSGTGRGTYRLELRCDSGNCATNCPNNCDDGNACTDDRCDPVSGCLHTPNAAACDDGNPCTVNDACGGGACGSGPALVCNTPPANTCKDGRTALVYGPLGACDPAVNPAQCSYSFSEVPCEFGCASGQCQADPRQLVHVDISYAGNCRLSVVPYLVNVPFGKTAVITFHNDDAYYYMDVWMSYGGGNLDIEPGATWTDVVQWCSENTAYTAWADITSGCASFRFLINCN